ncbi:DUF4003 family protein [Oceanobacillus rekensis]|uniref:DUF4003 family protein n=1 Tax=Oceanobacillus rekensis TaxID=937927 RepID=UPI000B449F70|nr:DUF4003 family protein [Oceanobacillus rekensis]
MQEKMTIYTNNFYQLNDAMKWKVSDKKILMTIASMYTMNNKELHIDKMLRIADRIKEQAGLFSALKSYSRFTTAASLDVKFDDPENQIDALFRIYEGFKNAKFKSGVFTYLAATIALTNTDSILTQEEVINRTKEIYDGMKQEHLILTGANDYPLAVLLANEQQSNIIQRMEQFYNELNENGFWKGNELQFLSHILTLDNQSSTGDLVNRSVTVMDTFKKAGIRTKRMYYPIIGMLALLPQDEFNMTEINQTYDSLNSKKGFKWQKDMNLIMAVALYVSEKLDNHDALEASIHTTLETILQAQQAVMVATIASTTAATNSSNGSN